MMTRFDDKELENIIGYSALYASMEKCRRGVLWKDSVAHFVHYAPTEVLKLYQEIHEGIYKPRKSKTFEVISAKKRVVMGISFRDRVFQRSLSDNAIYPCMTKGLIYDNAACQKGKGTDFARNRLRCHLQRFYRRHGLNGYALQCDIRGYYPNMPHSTVLNTFKRHLEPQVYNLVEEVLRTQYGGETGYIPGSQIMQIAGISVLDELDHFIKEKLRIRGYVRYMDDFILLHGSEAFLEECRASITKEISKLGLELHPRKTRIFPISEPIKFLGFYHHLTETGRIIVLIDPKNVKRERKKLLRMANKVKRGELSRAKVNECYNSWKAHAAKGNSHNLIKWMNAYYFSLWEQPALNNTSRGQKGKR